MWPVGPVAPVAPVVWRPPTGAALRLVARVALAAKELRVMAGRAAQAVVQSAQRGALRGA